MALITPDKDPMGRAVAEYLERGKSEKLRVMSSLFEEDEMPVHYLFRTQKDMNEMERKALVLARGRVLDVGAGAGCHALELQQKGLEVTAIDVSPGCVEVMRRRGVKDVQAADFFELESTRHYSTLLMLMNGSGIIGCLERMPLFFAKAKELMTPEGQILMDSCDLRYVYEDEEGQPDWNPEWGYYGQVDYRMQYASTRGETFDWLYVDPNTLKQCAEAEDFRMEMICCGENLSYLARLTLKK